MFIKFEYSYHSFAIVATYCPSSSNKNITIFELNNVPLDFNSEYFLDVYMVQMGGIRNIFFAKLANNDKSACKLGIIHFPLRRSEKRKQNDNKYNLNYIKI